LKIQKQKEESEKKRKEMREMMKKKKEEKKEEPVGDVIPVVAKVEENIQTNNLNNNQDTKNEVNNETTKQNTENEVNKETTKQNTKSEDNNQTSNQNENKSEDPIKFTPIETREIVTEAGEKFPSWEEFMKDQEPIPEDFVPPVSTRKKVQKEVDPEK